ncbi:hypothetical protein NEHOM01_2097 [Nematocida homosporus]|uniref:uncharacterized protein n=1 Tax=Nematocida homosporus TaxID=1912981 RepID=UPI00221F6F7E|nr:uncharacterized protein NEHOM01_2097 [Nematocida homosporus]KAI5187330.1 hypothetical protein NEHOM01_2097 [Nematocida homosporus]
MLDDVLSYLKRRKISNSSSTVVQSPIGLSQNQNQTQNQNQNLSLRKISCTESNPVVCTQTVLPTVQSRLLAVKQEHTEQSVVDLHTIRKSDQLKCPGLVIAYIKVPLQDHLADQVVLADQTDELVCSVHPSVQEVHQLEKDTILVLDSPAVWRLSHAKHTPVLNLTLKNIQQVVPY